MTSNHPETAQPRPAPVYNRGRENLSRQPSSGTYYALPKRGGKQFRRQHFRRSQIETACSEEEFRRRTNAWEQRRTDLLGAELPEERGAFAGFGFVGQDADAAVGMEAVDDPCAHADGDAESFGDDGRAAVGADFERGAHTPDVGPTRRSAAGPAGRCAIRVGRRARRLWARGRVRVGSGGGCGGDARQATARRPWQAR